MKPYQEQNYYELLEVPPGASEQEIRAAFARAAELYAADSLALYALENPSQAEELRARLHEAVEVLTDPRLRDEYNRALGIAPVEAKGPPSPLAMAEVIPTAETAASTHPEIVVSYVPPPPSSTSVAAPPSPALAAAHAPEREEPVVAPRRMEPKPALESAPQLAAEAAISGAEAAMAQVAAQIVPKVKEVKRPVEPTRERPADVAPIEYNGEVLRRFREEKGWTLHQLADRTRISQRHIQNVEADRYAELPAQVYLRGILINLARELGLDSNKVAKSYLSAMAAKKR